MSPHSNLRGIVAMVLAMGFFIAADTASKLALAAVPMFEVMTIRGYAGMVFCLIVVVLMDQGKHLAKMFDPWVLARGILEVFANFGFTLAIIHMPIADVTAIAQTAPLILLAGAWLVFGDKLGMSRLLLIALGLSGALLVAQPGTSAASPYAVLGFVVAVSAAVRDLITRKVSSGVPAPIAALAVLTCLTLASAVCSFSFETFIVPQMKDAVLMLAAGGLMVAGHVGIFIAYRIAQVRAVAPFMYSLTIWAVLSSVVVFGDKLNSLAIAGMALILLAGLLVIYLDGRRRRL